MMVSQTSGEAIELDRSECLALLAATRFGRLAVTSPQGTPLIRPVNYVFDDRSQSVVFRSGVGTKFSALAASGKAAFEIDGIDETTRTGWSVIISGVTEEITSPTEIDRLRATGVEPWAPEGKHHWVRVRAYTVTGRRIVLKSE